MSNMFRRVIRASVIGLMVGVAPVASAVGQEVSQPAAAQQPGITPAPQAELPSIPQVVMSDVQQAATAALEEQQALDALQAEAAALRPGQFLWHPERAPAGRVEMVVSLPQQKIYVYRANKLIAVSTISSGRPGHGTPTGSFPIIEKHRRHFSNLYNNAPMPNMQRLTMGGIALHAGQLPGYAASHGCVRLPMEFSRLLFGITSRGERVHIINGSPTVHNALALATGRGATQMASAS